MATWKFNADLLAADTFFGILKAWHLEFVLAGQFFLDLLLA